MFTRNPQGWKFGDLDIEQVKKIQEKLGQSKISPVVDHMPYLPKPLLSEDEIYEKLCASFAAEVDRCGTLGISYLVVHLEAIWKGQGGRTREDRERPLPSGRNEQKES